MEHPRILSRGGLTRIDLSVSRSTGDWPHQLPGLLVINDDDRRRGYLVTVPLTAED